MKKSKSSSDVIDLLDKQYRATLLIAKMMAALSVEIKDLNSQLKEQNVLINSLLAGSTLEE